MQRPSSSDLGLRVINEIYDLMRIDSQWSVWEPRGFTWWGWRSAQRVWSEPAVHDRGFTLYRLYATAELFDGFEDTDEQVLLLNNLVSQMTLSGIVAPQRRPGRIELAASVYVHEEILEWTRLLFSTAVAMQAAEAVLIARQQSTASAGLRPVTSAHPHSGPRPEMDDMLNIFKRVSAEGERSSAYAGEEMEQLVATFQGMQPPCVMASGEKTGLAAEFPYPGPLATSLLQLRTTDKDPRAGNGLFVLLNIPEGTDDAASARQALELNRTELNSPTSTHFLGSWMSKRTLSYAAFYPNFVHRSGCLENIAMANVIRARWLTEDVMRYSWEEHFEETLARKTAQLRKISDSLETAAAKNPKEPARSESPLPPQPTPKPPPPPSSPKPPPPLTPTPPVAPTKRSKASPYWRKFLSDFFVLHGRIGRATFIVRITAIWAACVLVAVVASANKAEALAGIFFLICVVSFVVQAGKRLHDINASAGWIIAGVTGLGLLVLSILLPFAAGTKGPNRFGTQSSSSKNTKIAALTICGLALLAVVVSVLISESNKSTGRTSALATSSPSRIAPLQVPSFSPTPGALKKYSGLTFQNSKFFDLTQPIPAQSRTVEGTAVHYSLAIPRDWTVKPKQDLSKEEEADFDLIASRKTVYIAVVAEEANLGDVDTVVTLSRRLLTQRGTDARLSNVEAVSIDGRKWRSFTAHVAVEKIPFAYQFYVYTGQEGTFQLMGWTFENLFDREAPQIREVLQSFKFPPGTEKTTEQVASAAETSSPSGSTSDYERELDLPTLAKDARPAVLLIVGFDVNGKITKSGSGFFISREGRIVTNWHVVDGVAVAAAKSESGVIYKIAGVLAYSIHLDLAVLKAEVEDVPFLAIDQTQLPEAGSKIAVIGSPHALEGSLSEGIVSAVRKTENGAWIQMTAPVSPGSSGSPVLNTRGRVVGVATLNSTGRYQNLNFARASQDLSILLGSIPPNAAVRPFATLATWHSSQSSTPNQPEARRTALVTASDKNGLHVRADHTAKSAIVATLHRGESVFLEDGYFRNDDPPEPVNWQQVTTAAGRTGWIRADYVTVSASGNGSP